MENHSANFRVLLSSNVTYSHFNSMSLGLGVGVSFSP